MNAWAKNCVDGIPHQQAAGKTLRSLMRIDDEGRTESTPYATKAATASFSQWLKGTWGLLPVLFPTLRYSHMSERSSSSEGIVILYLLTYHVRGVLGKVTACREGRCKNGDAKRSATPVLWRSIRRLSFPHSSS